MQTIKQINDALAGEPRGFGTRQQYKIAKRFFVVGGHIGHTDEVVEKTGPGAFKVGQRFGSSAVCGGQPAMVFAVGEDTDTVDCIHCRTFAA